MSEEVVVAEEEGEEYTCKALSARELEWAVNSPSVLEDHKKKNGNIIRTRFPPEPNGYLHIGHAKSMFMNFQLSFDKLKVPLEHRRTIFRYDDTNPDAECKEYIDSIYADLQWLGWQPERTTYSSDNFEQLYQYALQLIDKGLAYVCDMSKQEMEQQRELALKRSLARNTGKDPDVEAPIPSPDVLPGRNRNRSVQQNKHLFQKMKAGFYNEGTYTLRLKMDLESNNPNMYDLVAYRIKYTAHPHAGDGWCIYPAYDFTHGICDSIEHIDYSICTLEFETRREPYYWILWALDLYKPKVYEMSRLNVQYTVLSKRRLIKLVDAKYVRGWDDPRMPTVSGMRRRGYTKQIINSFCNDVGATRSMNVVEISKLHQTARLQLSHQSRRVMACLQPIQIKLTNFKHQQHHHHGVTFQVQNSPTDPSLGSHSITITETIYIDSTDFRLQDSPQYYGLAPNKAVGLKYHGGNIICEQIVWKHNSPQNHIDNIQFLKCRLDTSKDRNKPKTFISWCPSNSIQNCQIRVYNELFTVPEPTSLWEDELNPQSEILYTQAIIDPSICEIPSVDVAVVQNENQQWKSHTSIQFERMGYFVMDNDSTFQIQHPQTGTLIMNRIVSLKEEVFKKQLTKEEQQIIQQRKQRAQQDKLKKEQRMYIQPNLFFQQAEEYLQKPFTKFDDTGLPTHDHEGNELTKSAKKKLEKERQKHIKQLMKWKQQQEKQQQQQQQDQ